MQLSNNITVGTIEDGVTYSIDVSPSSVTIPADETSVSQNFNFYFYKKEGTGAKEAYSCYWAIFKRVGSTYTRLYGGGKATSVTNRSVTVDSTMDSLFIRIGNSSMASASDAFISEQPISITKQGDTGEQGPEGDAAEAYTIVVESAVASVSANGKLNANIVAHVVKTVGATSSVYPSGLTCKIGKQTVSPQARQSDDPYTFIVNNGDWTNTSTYNKASVAVLSFTLSSLVLATAEIPISVVGQMGRNIYFAGEASGLQGTTFVATDNMAPYVRSAYNGVVKLFVYIGESGTKTYPNNSTAGGGSTGYSDTSIWEEMKSEFKYLMAQAIFTEYAQLGSAIFNDDYMFSRHGRLFGANGFIKDATGTADYARADATDMMADDLNPTELINSAITVPYQSSYDNNHRVSLGSLTAGQKYVIALSTEVASGYIRVCAATSSSSTSGYMDIYSSSNGKYSYLEFTAGVSQMYLYYRGSSSSTKTIKTATLSLSKFRPNVFVDWWEGSGFFRNLTVEGIINNMIVTIDDNNKGSYGFYDGYSYYLNPLKTPSFMMWNLPYRTFLPCYCLGDDSTGEAIIFGDKAAGESFTLNEIRQCVGKKLYVLDSGNNVRPVFQAGNSDYHLLMVKSTYYTKFQEYSSQVPEGHVAGEIYQEVVEAYDMADVTTLPNEFHTKREVHDIAYDFQNSQGYTCQILECKLGIWHGYDCVYWELIGGFTPCKQPT